MYYVHIDATIQKNIYESLGRIRTLLGWPNLPCGPLFGHSGNLAPCHILVVQLF